MFILIFGLVMALTQFITNKIIGVDDSSEDSYVFSKKDSIIIGAFLLVGIVLEIITNLKNDTIVRFVSKYYWWAVCIYAISTLAVMLVLSELRKKEIEKKRADLEQVYEILIPIVDKGGKNGLDYNNPPFRLNYKYGDIQEIEVDIDPVVFTPNEKTLVPVIGQLDIFLPTFKWNYDVSKVNERLLRFIGEDKPPTMARWPGSWLRYFRFMPMGIAGKGEVGFKPDSIPKGQEGRSQFMDDQGNPIPALLSMPNAPQGMVSGATGGGKSVAVQNILMHCIEHRDKIALGLIDPKQVEFTSYNGMNGIVGVATNTLESVELLRIARQVMLKRNKEMANLGIKNIGEYKPQNKTNKVFVTGREYDENEQINIREDGNTSSMKAGELADYLYENAGKEVEVCLNGEAWITVNMNCVSYIYEDEMKLLLVIVDELAELTMMSGLKDAKSKEEDEMKSEIISILTSIAQLGRSAAVHVICCTQKPLAQVIPTLLRDNLVFKCFCGKATSPGASDVALGNMLATTIDNTHPGAGIVQAVGQPEFCRYYFSKFEDLYKYYEDRGLDKMGYEPGHTEQELALENLEGEEDLTINNESFSFEFENEKTDIDKRQEQKWEEV